MPVSLHAQRAAILVSEPARNGWNIYAGFNAAGGEQMAQIVVRDAFDTGQRRGAVY